MSRSSSLNPLESNLEEITLSSLSKQFEKKDKNKEQGENLLLVNDKNKTLPVSAYLETDPAGFRISVKYLMD
ncbi:hypothetical protein PPACK8108_LOCUS17467 [Phakopsora pachyrhizi]|uniref:Uncharacterized protein n=1 Tax=Phakopsora pachyrhizi TaxID=170000 RepID=A0AAV0BAY3_PHAPC|nr:hypothetical protein PPACK8108_LOCUS17467 [Phakopsora pachyrhizi]